MQNYNSGAIVILSLVFIYMCVAIYKHYFPDKPAFTSQTEFEKWLKLNKEQYNQIMLESAQHVEENFLKVLDERDKVINASIKSRHEKIVGIVEQAEASIRNMVNEVRDTGSNRLSEMAAGQFNAWIFLASDMVAKGLIDLPHELKTPEDKQGFLTALYFKLNPKSETHIHVKKT